MKTKQRISRNRAALDRKEISLCFFSLFKSFVDLGISVHAAANTYIF